MTRIRSDAARSSSPRRVSDACSGYLIEPVLQLRKLHVQGMDGRVSDVQQSLAVGLDQDREVPGGMARSRRRPDSRDDLPFPIHRFNLKPKCLDGTSRHRPEAFPGFMRDAQPAEIGSCGPRIPTRTPTRCAAHSKRPAVRSPPPFPRCGPDGRASGSPYRHPSAGCPPSPDAPESPRSFARPFPPLCRSGRRAARLDQQTRIWTQHRMVRQPPPVERLRQQLRVRIGKEPIDRVSKIPVASTVHRIDPIAKAQEPSGISIG